VKFSIIHPTIRFNPEQQHFWAATMKDWQDKCANPADVEYLVIVHESHYTEFLKTWDTFNPRPFGGWGYGEALVNRDKCCLAHQTNRGLRAATGDILIRIDDDMYPPQNWDALLSDAIPDAKKPVCVHVSSGSPLDSGLFLPSICTRSLQALMGALDPAYDHMYHDNEFTEQAKRLGEVVERRDLLFEHRHYLFGKSQEDAEYKLVNQPAVYAADKAVFDRRRAQGFPFIPIEGWPKPKEPTLIDKAIRSINKVLNPAPVIVKPRQMALCLPGEVFRHEWLASIFNVIGALGELGFTAPVFMGYCADPHVTRMMMTDAVLERVKGDAFTPYVLWIDDDNIVPPETIRRWVSEFDANPKMDILCGWCWIQRGVEWSTSLATFGPGGIENKWLKLSEVFKGGVNIREVKDLASGFPCIMMRREVLETLGAKAFIPIPHEGATYGQLSEDFSFMYRAKEAGFRAFIDPLGKVGHLKIQSQEPTITLPENAPPIIKQWREKINGKSVEAPEEYRNVGA
jgi:hypothetical protein